MLTMLRLIQTIGLRTRHIWEQVNKFYVIDLIAPFDFIFIVNQFSRHDCIIALREQYIMSWFNNPLTAEC